VFAIASAETTFTGSGDIGGGMTGFEHLESQASSESFINTATGGSTFVPTLDTTASISLFGQRTPPVGPPSNILAGASPNTTATFLVGPSGLESGIFSGSLYLAANGSNTSTAFGTFNLSTRIDIGVEHFILSASKSVANDWIFTATTPSGVVDLESASLNRFLNFSWPISPGTQITLSTDIQSTLGANVVDTAQGLWQFTATAFGWGAELPGDTDNDDDVDSDDLSSIEG